MIIIIVVFLTAAGPIGTLQSQEDFATVDLCNAALKAEIPRLTQTRAILSAQLGAAVTFEARCVETAKEVTA